MKNRLPHGDRQVTDQDKTKERLIAELDEMPFYPTLDLRK